MKTLSIRKMGQGPGSSNPFLIILACLLLALSAPNKAFSQRTWTFQFSLGDAYCFDMPLTIEQEGYEKIELKAKYKTKSFQLPVYYSWKIGTANGNKGWELELTHLKITLTNNPPEVQHFEISHGYNYLTINRIWDYEKIMHISSPFFFLLILKSNVW